MPQVRVALAQTNPLVGDISVNLDRCFAAVSDAAAKGAELVLFGEIEHLRQKGALGFPYH